MRAAQNVIEQGGFARAKKTGKQSDWNRIHASSATRQKENPAMMRGNAAIVDDHGGQQEPFTKPSKAILAR
ncbi:MAG: hypothetical protein U1E47_00610, partial [Rivihabitans pingtungensis]